MVTDLLESIRSIIYCLDHRVIGYTNYTDKNHYCVSLAVHSLMVNALTIATFSANLSHNI